MNKKRLTVLALMMALLMVLSLSMLVACNKPDDSNTNNETSTEITATEGLLISNSDFKVVDTSSTAKYPLSITSWTGAKMYSAGDYNTGVIAGAISLEESLYAANRETWKDDGAAVKGDSTLYDLLKSHYSSDENAVNNALMIYMPTAAQVEDDEDYGPTAYGYTSSSFSLEAAKYYKLTVDVLTYKIAGNLDSAGAQDPVATPGARIYISSGAYAEYKTINTDGEWTTYTIYFESAATTSTSLTVQLSLGNANSTERTNSLTTGYAFFDNVNLEVVDESAYNSAKVNEANDPTVDADDTFRKTTSTVTCKVPNGRFDFGTTSIGSSAAASNWSVVMGNSGKSDAAPSGSYYNGIIDVSQFSEKYTSYSTSYYQMSSTGSPVAVSPTTRFLRDGVDSIINNFGDSRVGTNVYMLSQQTMTAQGLKSSGNIVIEKGKRYAISVSVYTFDIRGAGVTLELSGTGNPIYIKGISENKSNAQNVNGLYMYEPAATTGSWKDYTFYIEGNQYTDTSYKMTFWLGTGGTGDNTKVTYTYYASTSSSGSEATTYTANGTFSTGWAFFDELKLAEITEAEFDGAASGAVTQMMKDADADGIFTSGTDYVKVSLETDNLFMTESTIDTSFVSATDDSNSAFDDGTLGTPTGFSSAIDASDTTLPYVSADTMTAGVVSIADGADFTAYGVAHPGTPYNIASERAYMLNAKADSYYAIKTDAFTVKANSFYRISMWVKTEDVKSTAGLYIYLIDNEDESKSSFTLINTTDYSDEESPVSTWTEYIFYVRGANDEDTSLALKYEFGTGSRWTSSTLADGAAFICDMSMTAITYSDFTGASTGTTAKSLNLSSTYSYSFNNGGFDNFSFADTKGLTSTGVAGQLGTEAGVPSNWTLNNSNYAPLGDNVEDDNIYSGKTYVDDDNLVSGIIKLDTDASNDKYFRKSTQIDNLFGSTFDSDFNLLYGAEDNTYFENYKRIGGPSMLAIAGLNGKKYFRSYKSDSFTLSSGTNYELSVWVKNLGEASYSVYLTGASGGMTYFGQQTGFVNKESATRDWTEYKFYIEVGLTSVSLNLNLALGYDSSIFGTVPSADEFSSGVVLFDNVTLTSTLTTEEFDAITDITVDNAVERKVSFLSNGFEISDGTTYASDKPITPSGFTGAVGTEQSASNTVSGTIFADNSAYTYPVDAEDAIDELYASLVNSGYVSLFGQTYEYEDYEILQTEIDEAKSTYTDKTDDEIKVILQKLRMYNDMKDNYITVDELKKFVDNKGNDISSIIGNSYLVINNTAASAYTYTSSSYTFSAETAYRVSVWVRTYNVTASSGGASVQLYLGSANEADAPLIFKNIDGTTDWTKYTFIVKTLEDNVTSVTVKLGLGEYDADNEDLLSSGYAMFDAVEIEIIDDETFTTIEEESKKDTPDEAIFDATSMKIHTVPEASEEGNTEVEEPTTETPDNSFNLDMLWWMIPTILLAIATIAVVVAYFVRKIRKPKKASVEADETLNTEAIEEKRSKYEDYNE